eukprot:TRINITY_DN5877_c0_g2_i1.p1 TRINITY_DN5877_c0_g2~~TRINITY_DN5877_c0_g2_i1.p1  ORF type:complete len:483 (+),score=39.36 TRINITY_DN5877_c0_g2_i1:149-1450(+)
MQIAPKLLKRASTLDSDNKYHKHIPYTCYEPSKGLSHPVITIATIIKWPRDEIERFIRFNRLLHAKTQGYRFCELNEPADLGRHLVWSRVPFTLSLLPCTDYVIYMDSDAIVYDPSYSFDPWIELMQAEQIDLLLSEDRDTKIPIDLGVFIVRHSDWTYSMLRSIYNICACEKSKIQESQGEVDIIHAWLRAYMDDSEFNAEKHVKIVDSEGWNMHWEDTNTTSPENFVVHYARCCPDDIEFKHKYPYIVHNYAMSISHEDIKIEKHEILFAKNYCKPIVWKQLTHRGDITNKVFESSLLDFDLSEGGELDRVEINSQNCLDLDKNNQVCALTKNVRNTNDTIYRTRTTSDKIVENQQQNANNNSNENSNSGNIMQENKNENQVAQQPGQSNGNTQSPEEQFQIGNNGDQQNKQQSQNMQISSVISLVVKLVL